MARREERMKNNLVAKHMRKYNKPAQHRDRKAEAKRGYRKHKKMA
jgi:hypothetical protein